MTESQIAPGTFEGHQTGETADAKRRKALLAPPKGLPLVPENLDIPLYADDLRDGTSWPPGRVTRRDERMDLLWRAANGDLRTWLPMVANPRNLYLPLVENYQAVLTDTPPEIDGLTDAEICDALDNAIFEMLTYGRTYMTRTDSAGLVAPDTRFAYRLMGTPDPMAIATVRPVIDEMSGSGEPHTADVMLWAGSRVAGSVRDYSASSTTTSEGISLGSERSQIPAEQAKWGWANRGTGRWGYGASLLTTLLPVLVEMAQHQDGYGYILRHNSRPVLGMEISLADLGAIGKALSGVYINTPDEPTAKDIRLAAPGLRDHDVLPLIDGLKKAGYITWGDELGALNSYLDRLSLEWTAMTGLMPSEASDSADVPSGVAYARRQAAFIIRVKQLWRRLRALLESIFGVDAVEWPWIDSMTEMAAEPPGDPAPAPDPDPEPDDG